MICFQQAKYQVGISGSQVLVPAGACTRAGAEEAEESQPQPHGQPPGDGFVWPEHRARRGSEKKNLLKLLLWPLDLLRVIW